MNKVGTYGAVSSRDMHVRPKTEEDQSWASALLREHLGRDDGQLHFYQRRGFRIVAVHPGAAAAARRLKPTIPELGEHGIPIRDEIELELTLEADRGA
jgi:hypothetical protein